MAEATRLLGLRREAFYELTTRPRHTATENRRARTVHLRSEVYQRSDDIPWNPVSALRTLDLTSGALEDLRHMEISIDTQLFELRNLSRGLPAIKHHLLELQDVTLQLFDWSFTRDTGYNIPLQMRHPLGGVEVPINIGSNLPLASEPIFYPPSVPNLTDRFPIPTWDVALQGSPLPFRLGRNVHFSDTPTPGPNETHPEESPSPSETSSHRNYIPADLRPETPPLSRWADSEPRYIIARVDGENIYGDSPLAAGDSPADPIDVDEYNE